LLQVPHHKILQNKQQTTDAPLDKNLWDSNLGKEQAMLSVHPVPSSARNTPLKELPKCKKMWLGIIMHNA
jgi:hypothetical protein